MMTAAIKSKLATYKRKPLSLFLFILVCLCGIITISALVTIILFILINGVPYISWDFLFGEYNSTTLSAFSSIVTTLEMIVIALLITVPLGVFCAIYMEEYAKRGNKFVSIISLATETLAAIPSIIYGLFGLIFFVTMLNWQTSIVAGACTLSIMVLPIIIRSTQEALRSVPDTFREGSFGLGASKLSTVFKIVVPSAMPGILSGVILAIGRIVGESAALIFTSGTNVGSATLNIFESRRTLAIHMYMLASEGLPHSRNKAFATGVILIAVVFLVNLLANKLANKLSKEH